MRAAFQGRYVGDAKLYNDLIGLGEPGWGLGFYDAIGRQFRLPEEFPDAGRRRTG